MIQLEYITGLRQDGNTSHAIKSHRNQNQAPQLEIIPSGSDFIFKFHGLVTGAVHTTSGTPRANHFDVYIGLNDLDAQRGLFPVGGIAVASSRTAPNPVGLERAGGVDIKMVQPREVLRISDLDLQFVGYETAGISLSHPLYLDVEHAEYNVDGTSGELHLGIGGFSFLANRAITGPSASFKFSGPQYAAFLKAIDLVINWHRMMLARP